MTSTAKQTEEARTPALGKEGEPCGECGKPLAADQRYCLNCGHRRGESRVDFERHLFAGGDAAAGNGRALAAAPSGRAWNPLVAVGLIALLAIMLLVGVLIGMEDDDEQTTTGTAPAQGAAPTATAPAATPPAATTPATPPATTTPPPPPAGAGTAAPVPGGAGAGGNAPQVSPEAEAPIGPRGTK